MERLLPFLLTLIPVGSGGIWVWSAVEDMAQRFLGL